mgnify:CR=1 FL=1
MPFKFTFVIFFILAIMFGLFLTLDRKSDSTLLVSTSLITNKTVKSIPASTPQPFYDLTIDFLRGRKYESRLGELQSVSSNGSYSSYVTHYLSDNLKINALLTKPTGQMPEGGWPAIVFVHGYIPPTQYQTIGQAYSSYVDYLARNGFVVLKIDLRGHGSSEGEAGGAYYSSDYVIDTLNAYSALANTDFVNPKKIGLWGHSMAGNVVLRSFAAKVDIPAVAIWAGAGFTYLDLAEFGISDNSYRPPANNTKRQERRQLLRDTYGDPKDGNPFWQKVAPIYYVSDLKGAISLYHATDDNVVNVEYSRNLSAILDKTGVSHDINEYPSGGHNISGANFTNAMQKTVEFFKNNL